MIAVIILAIVFILIAVRQIGRFKLKIWQIMLFGAVAVLVTGSISFIDAVKSINLDVMFFLFGMFVVGQALEESGYLAHISYKIFKKAKTADHLILLILFVMGFAAAFLMNDTIAIIGTPIVLLLSRKHSISPKLLLLALAFAVTIGTVMSPIGNPQNLLIAINGNIQNPFITFFKYLLIPTIINLIVCYFILKFFYKDSFNNGKLNHSQEPIKDQKMALLSKISVILIFSLILLKILFIFLKVDFDFRLTYIALIAALPILLFSSERVGILKRVDWHTLIFFAAMFILMEAVWQSGFFQSIIDGLGFNITSIVMILLISILLSQLISNVPLVALYLPMLIAAGAGAKEMVALAAGSTIAGNLLILGAASNVIIIQNAEKKTGDTLSFMDFAKVGIPLTIVNVLIYWLFLVL